MSGSSRCCDVKQQHAGVRLAAWVAPSSVVSGALAAAAASAGRQAFSWLLDLMSLSA
jgi:hypothetical protein